MLTKRIIPCLDVKDGRVVKGTHFIALKDAGDPVELAEYYDKEGADELVFLDITASLEKRRTIVELVKRTASKVFIPFTVGGGIGSIEEIKEILRSGADKVSINTQAVKNPSLIREASKVFGSQCIVIAIDAKWDKDMRGWRVYINGGTTPTNLEAVSWAKEVESLGAGEILLTSIDADGTQQGYDITLTRAVAEAVNIPVIASGGAGNLEHIRDALKEGKASAALIASLLHYKKYTVREIKEYLKKEGISVRL
ncbi:MAG: imidazole glycerol phosphate synthase subunit HisF [bacterium]|nr:imidazole glycerol phosphate synthase subunit HisF [bacterium]